jgi:hypothetical protein
MSSEPLHEAYRLIREGSKEEARRLLVPLVRADPLNADAWWLLANALEEPGKQRRALEKVLELRPDDDRAQRMYDRLLADAPPDRAALRPATAPSIDFDPAALFEQDEGFDPFDDLPPDEGIRVHKSSGGSGIVTIILALIGIFTILGCALCILTLTITAPVITRVVGDVMLTVTVMPEFAPLARLGSTPTAPALPGDLNILGSIETGETVSGTVDSFQDDGWTFSADAGERVIITLNAVDDAFDPRLYLYSPDKQLAAENDDVDAATNRGAQIEVTLAQGGKYTLRVSAFSGGGDYELTLQRQ